MLTICDARCSAKAVTEFWHDELDRTLTFCGHHAHGLGDALVMGGWVLLFDLRVEEMAG